MGVSGTELPSCGFCLKLSWSFPQSFLFYFIFFTSNSPSSSLSSITATFCILLLRVRCQRSLGTVASRAAQSSTGARVRACVCDHHASSQVKIGALFILLGPVILTKRQQRKKPGSGGNRVETGWRRASLAAHLLTTHASVSATYCSYTAVLTHIVRTSQLVLLWSGGEKHLKWAGLLFFWSCCAEGIDFQMCFYTFPHFSKLHLSWKHDKWHGSVYFYLQKIYIFCNCTIEILVFMITLVSWRPCRPCTIRGVSML